MTVPKGLPEMPSRFSGKLFFCLFLPLKRLKPVLKNAMICLSFGLRLAGMTLLISKKHIRYF